MMIFMYYDACSRHNSVLNRPGADAEYNISYRKCSQEAPVPCIGSLSALTTLAARSLSSLSKDFSYLCHHDVENLNNT